MLFALRTAPRHHSIVVALVPVDARATEEHLTVAALVGINRHALANDAFEIANYVLNSFVFLVLEVGLSVHRISDMRLDLWLLWAIDIGLAKEQLGFLDILHGRVVVVATRRRVIAQRPSLSCHTDF